MNTNDNEVLSPEWPGDFNRNIAIFLEDYRQQALYNKRRRSWAGVMWGVSVTSASFVAAWPLAKSVLG
jgi:hypothetical protein